MGQERLPGWGEMLGDDHSSREIRPATFLPPHPARLPQASPPPSSALECRVNLPGSPQHAPFLPAFHSP